MTTPDTTEEIVQAFKNAGESYTWEKLARAAIQAHNRKMAELVPSKKPADFPEDWTPFERRIASMVYNEARRLFLSIEEGGE